MTDAVTPKGIVIKSQGGALRHFMTTSLITLLAPASLWAGSLQNPVTATRNVNTECGEGSSQARCNSFIADHLAYERQRDAERARSAEQRRIRNEEALREAEIVTLPKLNVPANFKFSPSQTKEINAAQAASADSPTEWEIKFFIDQQGVPYHVSAHPWRQEGCTALASVGSLNRLRVGQHSPPRSECVSLDGVTFSPALTSNGTPTVAEVVGRFRARASGMRFDVVSATPVLNPTPNTPSQRWIESQRNRAENQRVRELQSASRTNRDEEWLANAEAAQDNNEASLRLQECHDARSKLEAVTLSRALRPSDLASLRRSTDELCDGVQ